MASNKNNGDNESRDYSEKARMSMPTVNSKKKEPSLQRLVNDESVEMPLTTVEQQSFSATEDEIATEGEDTTEGQVATEDEVAQLTLNNEILNAVEISGLSAAQNSSFDENNRENTKLKFSCLRKNIQLKPHVKVRGRPKHSSKLWPSKRRRTIGQKKSNFGTSLRGLDEKENCPPQSHVTARGVRDSQMDINYDRKDFRVVSI